MKNKVLLAIMDGWGVSDQKEHNAIYESGAPNVSALQKKYPNITIYADGEHVGLPDGQMGNSEVGHLNLGAGRIVYQELTRINKSIKDGDFFTNETLLKAIEHVKKHNSSLHFMGLVSEGGVHSSMDHLFGLVALAKMNSLKDVYVHAFLDGRDTPPQSALTYVAQVEDKLSAAGLPPVATVTGRYYVMDRDNRWDRVQKAYDCLVLGEGEKSSSALEAIKESYDKGNNDEFVLPTAIGGVESRIKDNDAVIFFNFRPDRAREITRALNFENFDGFERKKLPSNLYYVCMTQYDETFGLPIAFPPHRLTNILGDVLDRNNVLQFRTAETEKYAHVTFFFNGGIEEPFASETRALVKSPKVATYDMQPEMSAYQVRDKVLEALDSDKYGFILVNFANPDMVGHTGVEDAAIKAVKTVDECIGEIAKKVEERGYVMLLTADHGNAECMADETGPFTAHTNNKVPLVLINAADKTLKSDGALCDVAPTVLELMGIDQPKEMTGESLIK
ncbi:MAG: 2,3-bisphosphoglycerate-independent phosphoglycerate mutase [Candidatus Gastranaerophilales bacterium]|nr:2,3-bisphosphoglycerate-independent phosphoglycerate mutase [Candidatus Gastranaerophilales bacterium]